MSDEDVTVRIKINKIVSAIRSNLAGRDREICQILIAIGEAVNPEAPEIFLDAYITDESKLWDFFPLAGKAEKAATLEKIRGRLGLMELNSSEYLVDIADRMKRS